MRPEIDFLHFEIAAGSEGIEGGAEDVEGSAETGEEGAAVDVVEGVWVGPLFFGVCDYEVAVWWGTSLVRFVFCGGEAAYDVDWIGLRSLPVTVELGFWRAGDEMRLRLMVKKWTSSPVIVDAYRTPSPRYQSRYQYPRPCGDS